MSIVGDKIYYVYKITDIETNRYYIGKTSCIGNPDNHAYYGGGVWIRKMAMSYGKLKNAPNYARKNHFKTSDKIRKDILKIFKCENAAFIYEHICISDKWKFDDLCMNMKPGGEGGHRGQMHPSYDGKVYRWVDVNGNVIFHTKNSLAQLLGDSTRSSITTCVNDNGKNSVKGWYYAGTIDNPIEPRYEKNIARDDKCYRCVNLKDGSVEYYKRWELPEILGCSETSLPTIIKRGKSVKITTDWIFNVKDSYEDIVEYLKNSHTVNGNLIPHKWIHNESGKIVTFTVKEMTTYLECVENSIYRVVNGGRLSIKGWSLLKEQGR